MIKTIIAADEPLMHQPAQSVASATPVHICQIEYLERLPVHQSGYVFFIKAEDVDWIEAEGNYALLHIGEHVTAMRSTLNSLERALNPKQFVRIHRSTIVNKARVRAIFSWFNGYHKVVLETGRQLRMSRYQQEAIRILLNGATR